MGKTHFGGTMNIYQRLNEVRKKIDYIRKDAEVQGYRAVTHDMVTAMAREHLIEFGVMVLPSLARSGENLEDFAQESVPGETKSGTKKIRYEAVFDVSFINIEDSNDIACVQVPAHAEDTGDKAPGKALSYATKAALLKVFNIETGVNDESRLEEGRKMQRLLNATIEELREYMESGDGLGVYLLQDKVGEDAWSDIFNSAPEGKKTAYKKELRELETQGSKVLVELNKAIQAEDAYGAKELVEDITDQTKRMLANKLGRAKAAKLGELIKSLEE